MRSPSITGRQTSVSSQRVTPAASSASSMARTNDAGEKATR